MLGTLGAERFFICIQHPPPHTPFIQPAVITAPHDRTKVGPSHSFNRPLIFPIYYCMSVAPVRVFFLLPSLVFLLIHGGKLGKKKKADS